MKTRNAILTAIFLILVLTSVKAQDYKIVGTEIVSTNTPTKEAAKLTNLTHTIKGVKYPVYISKNGKYFIKRISKKTNKQYNQYLKM